MQTRMHMSTRSMFWFLVVVMTLGTSLTYADDNDVVVVNPDSSPGSLSRGELQSLPPVFNRLKAPDTSRVTPDTGAGPHLAGAKAKDGSIRDVAPRAFGSFGFPIRLPECRMAGRVQRAPQAITILAQRIPTGRSAS
jgi:hypothetical protein